MIADAAPLVRARSSRLRALVLAAALATFLALGVLSSTANAAIDHAAEIDPAEHALLAAINDIRAEHGLGPLESSVALERAADRQSYWILDHDWFSHDSRGTSFAVRVRRYVSARRLGETLAWSASSASAGLGRSIAERWLRSSVHRAELLNPGYRRIGVGRRGGKLGSMHANVFTADFASG